jgi:hypothetical protein
VVFHIALCALLVDQLSALGDSRQAVASLRGSALGSRVSGVVEAISIAVSALGEQVASHANRDKREADQGDKFNIHHPPIRHAEVPLSKFANAGLRYPGKGLIFDRLSRVDSAAIFLSRISA